MRRLLIFDLDGVLVSTKELHFVSLNIALPDKYKIAYTDHVDRYDGLPTLKKLQLLTKEKHLPEISYDEIMKLKQFNTFDIIRKTITKDQRLVDVLKQLKEDGYKIYVASNSIRETVKLLLYYSGLIEYVDYYISNEDVINPKPHPEMYLRCMVHAGVSPEETLIIEDSPRGIAGARKSEADVLIVDCPESVTYERIIKETMEHSHGENKLKLLDFNILIPMAGFGLRFEKAGYTFPKPLIEVFNKPMIQLVVENLGIYAQYIYVVRKEHYDKYNLKTLLNLITPNCKIIQVDKVTEGAACTTLLAKEFINNDNPLIIANSDQIVEWEPTNFYYKMIETKADGMILTFTATHPKWSFVKLDEKENVIEVAEKNPISNEATCGIYAFKKGSEYVKYAEQMINKNVRTNGEFYLCPVFNEYILDSKRIKTFHIEKMAGIGTPEDLETYLNHMENKLIVLDVGANNGDSTRHFADGVNEIYLFEPCPEMITEIQKKSEGLSNYHIFQIAISDYNGTSKFNIAGQGDWGCSSLNTFSKGLKRSWPGRTDFKFTDEIEVEVRRLDSFIMDFNIKQIDYLHCDAQGSDLLVLKGLGKYIDIVKEGVIEVALNKELALYKEVDNTLISAVDFLTKHGFRWMEISPWANESNIHFKRC